MRLGNSVWFNGALDDIDSGGERLGSSDHFISISESS